MSELDDFNAVLASLHDACLDDTLWPEASACGSIRRSAPAATPSCWRPARRPPTPIVLMARFCRGGHDMTASRNEYFEDYFETDEAPPRLTRLADSLVVPMPDIYTDEERLTSRTYNEYMRRGGCRNGLNVRLDGPGDASIYWVVDDPQKGDGWGPRQLELVDALLPHLRQFVRVRYALGGAESLRLQLGDLMDNTAFGAIYLGASGRIIETNDTARRALLEGNGLHDEGGHLRARVTAEDGRLQRILAAAIPRLGQAPVGDSMTVTRWPSRLRHLVHVLPVNGRQENFGIGRVAAMVLVTTPGAQKPVDVRTVAAALRLTDSESRVAVDLAMGKTVGEIAAETRRGVSTVRFHVKQIHTKLGLQRQIDLVRLVLSLGGAPPVDE